MLHPYTTITKVSVKMTISSASRADNFRCASMGSRSFLVCSLHTNRTRIHEHDCRIHNPLLLSIRGQCSPYGLGFQDAMNKARYILEHGKRTSAPILGHKAGNLKITPNPLVLRITIRHILHQGNSLVVVKDTKVRDIEKEKKNIE